MNTLKLVTSLFYVLPFAQSHATNQNITIDVQLFTDITKAEKNLVVAERKKSTHILRFYHLLKCRRLPFMPGGIAIRLIR